MKSVILKGPDISRKSETMTNETVITVFRRQRLSKQSADIQTDLFIACLNVNAAKHAKNSYELKRAEVSKPSHVFTQM